jgi:D-alanine-D-alanine ligase
MRIALTHNLRRDMTEASAEFDTPETIAAITGYVAALGHVVIPIDVTGSIPRLVARLDRARPDLVLNLAEGERGVFREAFYPALFEQLGYPHTGSPASVLALCLDKALAKRVVAAARVRVPAGELVRDPRAVPAVPLPAIVKPNFEGSSKGITSASVVTTRAELEARIAELCARYPDGVLVETYVLGDDVAMAWVEGLGVLPPIAYRYATAGPFAVYDFALKTTARASVEIEIPGRFEPEIVRRLEVAAERTFAALGVRGYGRADYRVTPDGEVVFLEMNPLPSLCPDDKDLYGACAVRGTTPSGLFARILRAAGAYQPERGSGRRAAGASRH